MNKFRIKYNELINLTLGSDNNNHTEKLKKLESNPKFADVISLLNKDKEKDDASNNLSNNGKNSIVFTNTKSFSSANNEQKGDSLFNKPVNIPSLKQKLFNHQQKKAPMKLFRKTEEMNIEEISDHEESISTNKKKQERQKAKSFSTNSWEVSDKISKLSLSEKEKEKAHSTTSDKDHEKNSFGFYKKKALNLKSSSMIRKQKNTISHNINFDAECEGQDAINQYIKDLNKSFKDSDSSKNKLQSPKFNNINSSGSVTNDYNFGLIRNNYYCINVYMGKK